MFRMGSFLYQRLVTGLKTTVELTTLLGEGEGGWGRGNNFPKKVVKYIR